MTQREIIDAIAALSKAVEVNRGMLGSEKTADMANEKIRELIPLLLGKHEVSENEAIVSKKYAETMVVGRNPVQQNDH